jgi:hypothetical protein
MSSNYDMKDLKNMNSPILLLIVILIGAYCVHLSWSCNSSCYPDMTQFEKIFRAIGAFFGNICYLITYFIYWRPQCVWGPCATSKK